MEPNKPLEDWEIRRLAEKMSPLEFDEMAVSYLEMTKAQLDKIREDAGGNSINYMANSLTLWRDSSEQNEARQILYSKLTKAADQGLIARTSFQFLVEGDEEKKEEDCPLAIWAIFPLLTAVYFFVEYSKLTKAESEVQVDSMSATFMFAQKFQGSATYDLITSSIWSRSLLIYAVGIVFYMTVLPFIMFFLSYCLRNRCCKGHKPNKRNRKWCSFIGPLIWFLLNGFFTVYYFYLYADLRYLEVPEKALADNMYYTVQSSVHYDDAVKRSWDKLQLGYECCGVYNYTDWANIFSDEVPISCCKQLGSSCGSLLWGPESINQAGCVSHLATHISDQIKRESFYFLIFLVLAGFLHFIFMLTCLIDMCLIIKRNVTCKNRCEKSNEKNDTELLLDNDENDPALKEEVDPIKLNSDATVYFINGKKEF